jgi:hypothetical protein
MVAPATGIVSDSVIFPERDPSWEYVSAEIIARKIYN